MPDATSPVTVDGVEPSILVNLLDISDNPAKVKIFTDDNGGERWLVKESDTPVLVTNKDLAVLGPFGIEIVGSDSDKKPADGGTVVKLPPAGNTPHNLPGQTG